jgi:hypothetical protein
VELRKWGKGREKSGARARARDAKERVEKTMRAMEQAVKSIKPDFMFYGEGWNMPTELPYEQKTITEHHANLPYISFFNDAFRNAMKGGNFEHDILSDICVS